MAHEHLKYIATPQKLTDLRGSYARYCTAKLHSETNKTCEAMNIHFAKCSCCSHGVEDPLDPYFIEELSHHKFNSGSNPRLPLEHPLQVLCRVLATPGLDLLHAQVHLLCLHHAFQAVPLVKAPSIGHFGRIDPRLRRGICRSHTSLDILHSDYHTQS